MEPVTSVFSWLTSFSALSYLTVFTCTVLLAFIHHVVYEPFNYWKKRGVPQVTVKYPLVGNLIDSILKPSHEVSVQTYTDFPNERFVGSYVGTQPMILIRDPDLIESILIKDFSFVQNRGRTENPNNKLSKNLLNLKDDHWRDVRSKLVPTFSSGKLKGMLSQLVDCGDSLLKYMETFKDGRPFEIRDVVARYTMDVIASCAFGLNIDTINDPKSEFRTMGLAIFKPTLAAKIISTMRFLPAGMVVNRIRKLFSPRNKRMEDFFINAVDTTIEYRKKNSVSRPDFLNMMNDLKTRDEEMIKNNQFEPQKAFVFDHNCLVSNAFVFFLAGFETTATTVSYSLYELAINPDVQERACEEVSRVLKDHGGEPSYDAIQGMKYLEMVLSETLRKYPPATSVTRRVSRDYRLPGSDLVLPVDTVVSIPTYAIHHDPQYHPEPERFSPERFDDQKNFIRKNTYLPFGGGPRVCIGERFAKLEAKLVIAMLLSKYEFIKCDKTRIPLKFDKNSFLLVPEGGIWLSVRSRSQE